MKIFRDSDTYINIYKEPEEKKFWTIEDFYYERRRKNRNVLEFDVPILFSDDMAFNDSENNTENKRGIQCSK